MSMRHIFLTICTILTILPLGVVYAGNPITYQELSDNMALIFPQAGEVAGLEYHSNWQEVDRDENYYGIEVEYQALYDDNFALSTELPVIYTYIVAYNSDSSAVSAFENYLLDEKFDSGEWILLNRGSDSFSYKTGAGSDSDVMMSYSAESNTLHYITKKENLLIVVNFFRRGGEYNRGNVLAYEGYIVNYDETLDVLASVGSYIKEAVEFYLDDIEPTSPPTNYDYYLNSASYSLPLDDIYAIPLNGSISFQMYLDDTSEIGTILDSSGITGSQYGTMYLGISENATLDFNFYDPNTNSSCDDSSGWHHIYTTEPIDLYEWTGVKIEYGMGTGIALYLNDLKQGYCEVKRARSDETIYLGDYPGDIVEESFVGYVKDMAISYAVDETGQTWDSVVAESQIFTDVYDGDQYSTAISYLKDNGIISGYEDGSFKPNQEINRAEVLKMLLEGLGYDVPTEEFAAIFTDVESASWYEKYILYASELGIVSGYPDGTFKPSQNVNKVEFLKILTRSYGLDLSDYPVTELYPDTDMTQWYAPYVQYSKDNTLMDPAEDGNFYPANNVTRGEVAETLYRLVMVD
ncbi:TPA: hypothetical protein DCW56_04245 [Candidatus Peregrinibacteria bacterium]|nr:hypothetical protein [Candidatus Peregrinibacteria bacterium]